MITYIDPSCRSKKNDGQIFSAARSVAMKVFSFSTMIGSGGALFNAGVETMSIGQFFMNSNDPGESNALTSCELEILNLVAQDMSYDEICRTLKLDTHILLDHLGKIMHKLVNRQARS